MSGFSLNALIAAYWEGNGVQAATFSCSLIIAVIQSFGPTANPTRQPVIENFFEQLSTYKIFSYTGLTLNALKCLLSLYTSVLYTSSDTNKIFRILANSTISVTVFSEYTVPVGFVGVFIIITFVLSVTAFSISSIFGEKSFSSHVRTITGIPPHISII